MRTKKKLSAEIRLNALLKVVKAVVGSNMHEIRIPPETFLLFNACTDPCDMLAGPCACGAWHDLRSQLAKIVDVIEKAKI